MYLKLIPCPICGHVSEPGQLNELTAVVREFADPEARAADPKMHHAVKVRRIYQCWNCMSQIKTTEAVAPNLKRGERRRGPKLPYLPLTPRPPGAILEQRRCVDPLGKPLYEDKANGRPCPCADKPCECAGAARARAAASRLGRAGGPGVVG